MHHELKIYPAHFARVRSGEKRFEIRRDDRGYQAGDTVTLKEFDPEKFGAQDRFKYTGQSEDFSIPYVTAFEQKPGWVVFGLQELDSAQQ